MNTKQLARTRDYFYFCSVLEGFRFYRKGREVFKYQLFHKRYDPDKILRGQTDVEVKNRYSKSIY
jgi:hypothetical protein